MPADSVHEIDPWCYLFPLPVGQVQIVVCVNQINFVDWIVKIMFKFYFQLTAYGFSVMLDHWMVTLKSELSKANLPALDLDDNSPLEEHVLSPRFDEDKVAEQLSAVVIEEKSNLNSSDVIHICFHFVYRSPALKPLWLSFTEGEPEAFFFSNQSS